MLFITFLDTKGLENELSPSHDYSAFFQLLEHNYIKQC